MNPLQIDNILYADSPIIIALDYTNEQDVMNLVKQLDPSLCKLKIGKELFTACGPKLVEKLVVSGYKVFLDLKFHDIPNTVHKACIQAANLGVWMINVHASGGQKMMEQAKLGIESTGCNAKLIAVTILTSMSEEELPSIGITDDLNTHITKLAKLTYQSGLDGVVCSANEARLIKTNTHSDFLTITPGIRLTLDKTDDQTRIMTPKMAVDNLADYLVIGRPITQATDPYQQLINIINNI